MTWVVHCKRQNYDTYIGRPSKWGNPFFIGQDGTREEVIAKFREYAKTKFSAEEISSLRGRVLGCWCAPLPCHGDVLAEMANEGEQNET